MALFVNEYEYTTDIISESIAAWWGKKYRNGYISMGICTLLALGLFLLIKDSVYLLLGLLCMLLIVLFKVKEKRAIKLQQERFKVLYKDAIPITRVEISEDIYTSTNERESRISFSDVENVVETKNLIVLFVKGSMTVTLDKQGFISGNADECMNYLKEHI